MNLYYIILIEWNYPTESGHEVYEYYDSLDVTKAWVKKIGDYEQDNFQETCGDIYSEASGFCMTEAKVQTIDPSKECIRDVPEYYIHSSQYPENDFWYRVRVIPVEYE